MEKNEVIRQTKLAFDFMQRLYLEISYFIKEIEGLLAEEDERFLIGRPSGYAITSRSSSGLETNNVNLWIMRTLSVLFVPEDSTKTSGGMTFTEYKNGLKVIFLRIILDDKDFKEPYINIGVLYDIFGKRPGKYPRKMEELIRYIESNHAKVFTSKSNIEYEDISVRFKGRFFQVNLYDLNSSDYIVKFVINPILKIFREIQ